MYSLQIQKTDGSVSTLDEIDSLKLAVRIAKMAEAEQSVAIYDERNNPIWRSDDSPALKRYAELDHEQWQSLTHGSHKTSGEPSVYFDIDGTLGKWYTDGKGMSLEEMIDPANHYFRDIEAIDYMVSLAERLHEQGVDVCVISAAYKDTIRDKWDWIQEHLPFIPEENICFAPIGADKTAFVKGNADISILIDDYNKNLEQWKGVAVKALNGINSPSEAFQSIDLYAVDKRSDARIAKANELLSEGIMTETAYDKLLWMAASDMAAAIKREGERLTDILSSIQGERTEIMAEHTENVAEQEATTSPAYEFYKKRWVGEHIDDITLAQTAALYENSEEAKNMTFDEYVQEYGFADGSCYASFGEFLDNEHKTADLAERIEQFMYDRGEYDFAPSERPQWLQMENADSYALYTGDNEGVGVSRENAVKNIIYDLEEDAVDDLIQYLETESNVMDEADELIPVAESLREEVIERSYGSEQAYINAKIEKNEQAQEAKSKAEPTISLE